MRQDRSARYTEKHRRQSRKVPLRGLIRNVSVARAPTDVIRGEKSLAKRATSDEVLPRWRVAYGMSIIKKIYAIVEFNWPPMGDTKQVKR